MGTLVKIKIARVKLRRIKEAVGLLPGDARIGQVHLTSTRLYRVQRNSRHIPIHPTQLLTRGASGSLCILGTVGERGWRDVQEGIGVFQGRAVINIEQSLVDG